MPITGRDRDIVEVLTHQVRVLSLAQVARTWWGKTAHPAVGARRRLRQLEVLGFVERFTLLAHPELDLREPIVCWKPGSPEPDHGSNSYRLGSRWTLPAEATPAVIASAWAGHQLGGKGGRRPRESEQTHDLHLASVYLLYRERWPELAASWMSEELIRRGRSESFGTKLPDAMIRTDAHQQVVEFGGAYGREKLRDFHRYCSNENLPYALW